MDASGEEVLALIKSTRELDEQTEAKLKQAIEDFIRQFVS